jgi:hypothetical protein
MKTNGVYTKLVLKQQQAEKLNPEEDDSPTKELKAQRFEHSDLKLEEQKKSEIQNKIDDAAKNAFELRKKKREKCTTKYFCKLIP